MDLGLTGRLIAIVGASQGIGAATARILAAEGAKVVLMARDLLTLQALRDEIRAAGGYAEVASIDILDQLSVDQAFERIGQNFGDLDGCVISAGAAQGGLMWTLDESVWRDAMDLKFLGMVRVLRAISPGMQLRKRGRIVVVVGNNGRQPSARMLPGSAANAACLAVIRGLAEELAADGVSVNALNPGPTRTGRWDRLIAGLAASSGQSSEDVQASQLKAMPRGRIAEPEEMGRLAAILCSDLSDMVTGSALTADGGATKGLP
jgi:3-oxoacyl-[acyl-carrier protein] reductase